MSSLLPTPKLDSLVLVSQNQDLWREFNLITLLNLTVIFFLKLAIVGFLIFVGFKLINLLTHSVKKLLKKHQVNSTLIPFLATLINLSGRALILIAAGSILGLTSTSVAALIGTMGLALGLALQGALANFAGGVLILALKPFGVGDYILVDDGKGQEGKVKEIQIFYTHLATLDNKTIIIPNGNIMKTTIINFSHEDKRRMEIRFKLDHQADLTKAKEIALKLVREDERVLAEPEPTVYVLNIDEYGVDLSIRAWVKRQELFKVKTSLIEKIKAEFDQASIELIKNVAILQQA